MSSAVQYEYDLPAEDATRVGVVDIRGTRIRAVVTPVLADPSGVRARRLARAGRAIAFLCLLWLVGLGLAGIGILPAGDLPLGRAINGGVPGMLPGALRSAPSRFDRAGAGAASPRAASAAAERVAGTRSRAEPTAPGARHGTSGRESESSAVGHSPARSTTRRRVAGFRGPASGARGTGTPSESDAAASGTTSGPSQTAAGGVGNRGINAAGRGIAKAPGASIKAATRGQSGTAARGGTAPGKVRPTAATVTTAPGQSGASPGHTMTPGGGHGSGT